MIPFTAATGMNPCPHCGNKIRFRAVSQQVAEDLCEVWVECGMCDLETPAEEHRESVWGITGNGDIQALVQDWNDWTGKLGTPSMLKLPKPRNPADPQLVA
jgi:hypothetical protein